ncbi:hypothetical protein [Leeuwenhoekiella marinoflava]|uniref:Phenylalanyl-tRNA synthetase subunit alpha n=2 Tax=Leeuwenhoekiella marinoflava TaxID=988 RepID=A0A4Q0PS58_9FLAO|nr:hypothetical protein [Leeuwenhoekiella marinoflava]RXG33112.1 hypothetical protein DSL99_207 [Leeuwenhoekiella marinoflava]SHE38799.1 hypothetical protein SAMN02745246_00265 [Leeuwenhoekiella marinoflava DSM 3653]
MRKDINIPEVADVYVAAVKEFNETHRTDDWNAYIVNDSDEPLELVLIVSNGYNEKKKTSLMRHKLQVLPAKSFAKIEFIEDSVLELTNEFAVTYFLDGKMFEKTFVFKAGSIKDENKAPVPSMLKEGVLAE